MQSQFESQRGALIQEYELKIKEQSERMGTEFETMRTEMQAKIDDLVEQLRRERESLQGGEEQVRDKL